VTAAELGLPEITPETAILNLPSWCNPGFSLAMFQVTPTVISIAGGATKQIAPNNPKRWFIGFQDNGPAPSAPRVGIISTPFLYGHPVSNNLRDSWFTLFVYGPMICYEWFATSVAGGDFLMYEGELQ
jgi:hypothetical protein